MAHIASVKIDTGLLLSNVLIETSGGVSPIACHGHRKGDAARMKNLIERYQSDYYRGHGAPVGRADRPITVSSLHGRPDLQRAPRKHAGMARPPEPTDPETRFRSLVQSPLRAGLLRYLSARPDESFDVEALMQTFGRLRLDVDNCVRELVDFGVARAIAGTPPLYAAERPADEGWPISWTIFSSAAPPSAPRISRRRSSASAR